MTLHESTESYTTAGLQAKEVTYFPCHKVMWFLVGVLCSSVFDGCMLAC